MAKKEKLDPYTTATMFVVENYLQGKTKTLRWWNNDFYVWRDGYYRRLPDSVLKADLAKFLYDKQLSITTHVISTIIVCLTSLTDVGRDIELNNWLEGVNGARVFPVRNGNVSFDDTDIETNRPRLLPHTPLYFSMSKADYDYDPKARCPLWLDFLSDLMLCNAQYVDLLQQWTGYLLTPDLRQQKFLLCTGDGANGKGVFFEVIKSLVGEKNCSQVGLASFNQRFALHNTLGKVCNLTHESAYLIEHEAENTLKSYVAGDTMSFERKFKEPISAKPTAKIMISTNALPRFNDKTNAIWRRVILVPFKKTIREQEQIKDLADILKKELSGILNWAMEGMEKLQKAGMFLEPDENTNLLEEYRRDADPARAFLLDNFLFSPNGSGYPCKDVYREYAEYCRENNYTPMADRQFGHAIRRAFPKVKRQRYGSDNERIWAYHGLVSQTSQRLLT